MLKHGCLSRVGIVIEGVSSTVLRATGQGTQSNAPKAPVPRGQGTQRREAKVPVSQEEIKVQMFLLLKEGKNND